MAIFSQGSYSELLEIIAQETVQAYVDARFNVSLLRPFLNIVHKKKQEKLYSF